MISQIHQTLYTIFTPFLPSSQHAKQIQSAQIYLKNPFQLHLSQSIPQNNPLYNIHPINQQLVSSNSYTNKNQNLTVSLAMSQKFLFLIDNFQNRSQIQFYTLLDFDLKFQVLRKPSKDQLTTGEPYGFRIQRNNGANKIQFHSFSFQVLQTWRKSLEKKINQRNFHNLFKAKKKIGKGAFATVYLAERLIDKKMVAVKAFSKQKQFSTKNGKQALINEIKLMRSVDHQNVIKLEGIYETENSIYVTLQNLEGGQLHERLKAQKRFSVQNTREIIYQLLKALRHLAQKKIIHRDLKTENIMFRKRNSFEIVLCDFGLATFADQPEYLFVRCGTPGFVSPQIINIKDMSTKSKPISDIFSAGIIFHYLLLGHSIFPGKKYNQVLVQNRACDFNFYQDQYLKLDKKALDLMRKMLQVNPQKRMSASQCLNHPYFTDAMDIQENNQNIKLDMIDETQKSISIIQKLSASQKNSGKIEASTTLNRKNSLNQDGLQIPLNWNRQCSFTPQGPKGKIELIYNKNNNKQNSVNFSNQSRVMDKVKPLFNSFNRSLDHKNSEYFERV